MPFKYCERAVNRFSDDLRFSTVVLFLQLHQSGRNESVGKEWTLSSFDIFIGITRNKREQKKLWWLPESISRCRAPRSLARCVANVSADAARVSDRTSASCPRLTSAPVTSRAASFACRSWIARAASWASRKWSTKRAPTAALPIQTNRWALISFHARLYSSNSAKSYISSLISFIDIQAVPVLRGNRNSKRPPVFSRSKREATKPGLRDFPISHVTSKVTFNACLCCYLTGAARLGKVDLWRANVT